MQRQAVLHLEVDLDRTRRLAGAQHRRDAAVGRAVQRRQLLLHLREVRHRALGQFRHAGPDLAQAEVARLDHAQPVHRRLGHRQLHHAAVHFLLRDVHQHGEIARAVVGLLQRLACLFHVVQGLLLAEMRIHRLLDDGDRQQRRALHPVFEYVETGFRFVGLRRLGTIRNGRGGLLRMNRPPSVQPHARQQAPHPQRFIHRSPHQDASAQACRPPFPAGLCRCPHQKSKGDSPEGLSRTSAGGIAPPGCFDTYWIAGEQALPCL